MLKRSSAQDFDLAPCSLALGGGGFHVTTQQLRYLPVRTRKPYGISTLWLKGVSGVSCVKTANTENCNICDKNCSSAGRGTGPYSLSRIRTFRTVLVWYYRERRARSVLPSTRPVPTGLARLPYRAGCGLTAPHRHRRGDFTLEQPAVQQLYRIPRAAQGAEMHLAYGLQYVGTLPATAPPVC